MTAEPSSAKQARPDPKKSRAQWLILGGLCVAIAGVLTFNALRPGTAPASEAVPTTAISTSSAAPATVKSASPAPTTASSASGHPVRPVIVTPAAPAAPVATTGNSTARAQLAGEAVPDMYQHSGTALPDGAPQVPTPPAPPAVSRSPARQAQAITPAPAVPAAPAYSAPVQLHAAPLPTTTQVIPAPQAAPVSVRPVVVPALPLPTVTSPRVPTPGHPTPVQVRPAPLAPQPATPAAPASTAPASTITLPPPSPAPYTFDGLVTGAEPVAVLTAPGGQILLSPGDAIPGSDLKLQSVTSSAAVLTDAHGHTTTLPLKGTDQ